MKEKEILFTTQTKYTFDEFTKYSDRVCRWKNVLSSLIWIVVTILLLRIRLTNGDYVHGALLVLALIAAFSRGRKLRKKRLIEAFQDPECTANDLLIYDFYSDSFVETCNTIVSEPIRYYDLRKIIETKTNFYLMYAGDMGCIIIKENCSPELIQFLKGIKNEPDSPLFHKDKEAKFSYNKTSQEIIELVGCPCEVMNKYTSYNKAMTRYEEALKNAPQDGYPIFVLSDAALAENLRTMNEYGYDAQKVLAKNLEDGKELLKNWYQESIYLEDDKEFMGELAEGATADKLLSISRDWEEYEEILLFKVPVDQPWKALAYIPMGGWNACPNPEQMLAISKYWYGKYGAIPAAIAHDTVEYFVETRITQERDAWDVAKEHFAFCNDAVHECTYSGTLGELGDQIRNSTVWYFWWD